MLMTLTPIHLKINIVGQKSKNKVKKTDKNCDEINTKPMAVVVRSDLFLKGVAVIICFKQEK